MNKSINRLIGTTTAVLALVSILSACTSNSQTSPTVPANSVDAASADATLNIAKAFLDAAGMGDAEKLSALMTDDFVWHNEGDSRVPWIGNWQGKDTVLNKFLPTFGAGLKTTGWSTDYSFANGDQAVFMGTMSATASKTGTNTGTFNWAVRVQVVNGKVKSWNWVEDSYAVSEAYHRN